jgi:hypothetical protein
MEVSQYIFKECIEEVDFIGYNSIRSLPYAGEKAPVVVYVEC